MPYLFDSYAFLAYFMEGKTSYKNYFENKDDKYTSILSLMETYSRIYHGVSEREAEEIIDIILSNFQVLPLDDVNVIKEAGQFRSKMLKKKKRLSYTDCINYILSQKQEIKLLTGDNDFRDLEDIEFVK